MKAIFSLITLTLLLLSADAIAQPLPEDNGALGAFDPNSDFLVVESPITTTTVAAPSEVAIEPVSVRARAPRSAVVGSSHRGQTHRPVTPAQVVVPTPVQVVPAQPVAPAQEVFPTPVQVVPVQQTVFTVPTVVPVSITFFQDIRGQATAPGATTQTFNFPFDVAFSNAAPAQGQADANGGQTDANAGQTSTDSDGIQAQDSATVLIKPYAVSLRRRSDLGYFCAGVLIGRRHVLTAAHCLDSTLPGGDTQPEVVVGSARLSQTSGPGIQVISTESVTFSPETPEGRSDLAILKLARRANQRPIRLPNSSDFLPNAGESLTGIGWGRTSTQSAFSDLVQFFQTTFVERNVCSESLNREIAPFNLCVGGEGGSSCSGDNGGPIIAERNPDLLVGIVGSQHACGQPIIDVHNSVAPSIDWIIETRRNT